ncbi:hypothetical protein CN918_31355 [Priestia megaterium]|nr:hypothetical protein CN918_31355 [Priestia megaterium]
MLKSHTAKIKGLFFEVTGEKEAEPILFIHGIGGSHEMFDPQVEYFAKRGYRCITIDLKGSGKSDNPGTRHFLDAHVESIDMLLEHLDIPKDKKALTIVGLSYGGIVSQYYTIRNQATVKKLVLIDTYGNLVPELKDTGLALFGVAIALAPWLPKAVIKPIFDSYKKWPLAHKEMMKIITNWRKVEMTLQLKEVAYKNFLRDLNQLQIPTKVIVGDFIPQVVQKSREIARNLPYGEFSRIENSMDPTNLCQPEMVNKTIHQFFEQHVFEPNKDFAPQEDSAVREMPKEKTIA